MKYSTLKLIEELLRAELKNAFDEQKEWNRERVANGEPVIEYPIERRRKAQAAYDDFVMHDFK